MRQGPNTARTRCLQWTPGHSLENLDEGTLITFVESRGPSKGQIACGVFMFWNTVQWIDTTTVREYTSLSALIDRCTPERCKSHNIPVSKMFIERPRSW